MMRGMKRLVLIAGFIALAAIPVLIYAVVTQTADGPGVTPDYADRLFEACADDADASETLTPARPDRARVARELHECAGEVSRLRPPQELRDDHEALVAAMRNVAAVLVTYQEGDVLIPESTDGRAVIAMRDLAEELYEAASEYAGYRP